MHEFYAAAHADGACLAVLAMMLGEAPGKGVRLWVRHEAQARETGAPFAAGIAELGLAPERLPLVLARDAASVLQAALEGARCAALEAVIVELWGETRAYDLTASRRLALAAKASGVPVLLLRVAARPVASAAETRWLARAAPSRGLAARAPGPPAFHLTLLRARNGQEGVQHHLEWNRDERRLESRNLQMSGRAVRSGACPGAPLPRPVVPVPLHRPGAGRDEPAAERRAG